MQEILQPLDAYRNELRDAHAKNTAEFFEELLRQSGVDEQANAATVDRLNQTLEELTASQSNTRWLGIARMLLVLGMIAAAIAAYQDHPLWAIGCVLALLLIFQGINPRLQAARQRTAMLEAQRDRLLAEAWAQMGPLNALFDWDIAARLLQRTLPLIQLDPYFTQGRLEELRQAFGWDDRLNDEDRSILCTHSGTLIGNPFVIAQSKLHWMSTQTYTGSKVISWMESYQDSNGRTQWRNRTQTLTASVTKPAPAYRQHSFLLYGSEAAPNLNFSREPSTLSEASDGFFGRWRKERAIAKLEAKAREMKGFTLMNNEEFDALFQALDRDHEVEFRLLFTPLAQQEMLKILKDQEHGFGDDFCFHKWNQINAVMPEHLSAMDIGLQPQQFHHHDLRSARQFFNDYHNRFFRTLYFSFAPLLCIPLYQQHRSHQDIYRDVLAWRPSFWELESLANGMGEAHFAHPESASQSILKISTQQDEEGLSTVRVTAHGYRGVERVDHVRVYGGDGNWHQVAVPWTDYQPVEQHSDLLAFNCHEPRPAAAEEGGNKQAGEGPWQERIRQRGLDPSSARRHRWLAGLIP